MAEHNRIVRRALKYFRGREVKTTGDGFLAMFDGPARAIRCPAAITGGVRTLGIEVARGAAHRRGGARGGRPRRHRCAHRGQVSAQAAAGEVLVSSTVRDLVAGSEIEFEDRGIRDLKGVPGEWRLFAVTRA